MKKRHITIWAFLAVFTAFVVYAGSGIETYDDATTVKDAIQVKLVDDLTELFAAVAAITAGSGVVVSSDDTTAGVLDGKLVAGEGIDRTVNNPAGNETMTISVETATKTNPGILETATDAEALALTVADKIITPANLGAMNAGEAQEGLVELATDGETITGTDTGRATTPANVAAKLADYTKDEDNMASDSASHVPTQQSVKAYVDASGLPGLVVRPQFTWVDADTITIGIGSWEIAGIGVVYITSAITFDLGSGGSNAGSDDLAASKWFNIALDYSAVGSAGALSASDFINRNEDNVTPAISGAKGAWYQDTNDRVIFAVLANGSSQILEFSHGGDDVFFDIGITTQAAVDIDTTWTDVGALTMPIFTTIGIISAKNVGGPLFSWRTNGSTGTHSLVWANSGEDGGNQLTVKTDSSHIIEVRNSADGAATIQIIIDAWKFPVLM